MIKSKEMNEAIYHYTADVMRKNIELQMSVFKDLLKLNKELIDLSPAKPFVEMFK